MAKADGGKSSATKAQKSVSGSSSQLDASSIAIQSWHMTPTPPDFIMMLTDCLVYLSGPVSEEELNRTLCVIECQEPGSNTWRAITDPNGQGTTFEPFNGAWVYDEATESGTHLYRARAQYVNGSNPPTEVISPSIEVEVENCSGGMARASGKSAAAKRTRAKS